MWYYIVIGEITKINYLEATTMKGFEFSKQFDTIEEKMIVLFMDAAKTAYNMSGIDFDSLTEQEKMDIVYKMMTR